MPNTCTQTVNDCSWMGICSTDIWVLNMSHSIEPRRWVWQKLNQKFLEHVFYKLYPVIYKNFTDCRVGIGWKLGEDCWHNTALMKNYIIILNLHRCTIMYWAIKMQISENISFINQGLEENKFVTIQDKAKKWKAQNYKYKIIRKCSNKAWWHDAHLNFKLQYWSLK